ncbi:MAG: phosphate ABC transporter substrate-binding protein PstS [Deltaproteobacteria bacterium]|nr:phosphate ABC transporter substrate-binding protein PstS [Deltaproteobacteria bacterium]
MRKISVICLLTILCLMPGYSAFAEALISGAGATFPYPLYSKRAYEYNRKTGLKLNYQSIGSGGGIQQIKSRTVDFGASDMPLADAVDAGLVQFPMAIGGVVPVVNLQGVHPGELRLTPDALAGIYLGKIVKWNDRKIAEANPGLKLPDDAITVVHRSDGSGTTWIFANYLDKVSAAWHEKAGVGTSVNWPVGVGGKGNEGVATFVKRIKNSIGYVEYVYAVQNKLTHARLRNRAGEFVEPSMDTFTAAAKGADWKGTKGFGVVLTDQPGKAAWPVSGATFILIPAEPKDCDNAKTALAFFDWAYKSGAEMARSLNYVPMPKDVYEVMEDAWASGVKCGGKPAWKR